MPNIRAEQSKVELFNISRQKVDNVTGGNRLDINPEASRPKERIISDYEQKSFTLSDEYNSDIFEKRKDGDKKPKQVKIEAPRVVAAAPMPPDPNDWEKEKEYEKKLRHLGEKMNLPDTNNPTQRVLLENSEMKVSDFMSKFIKGSTNNEFRGVFSKITMKDGTVIDNPTVKQGLQSGNRTIRKILLETRFRK